MFARYIVPGFLLLTAIQCRGDSIDDAEAKRRGIPVAQVQAENALAAQKRKNVDLEKQVADLSKKLTDAKGQAGATPTPVAGTPSAAEAPGPAVAATPPVPDTPLNFDGPREPSPLYDDFVNRYLTGDWATLAADMTAKKTEIAALPVGNNADLLYIQRTLAECRPAWWAQTKAGKPVAFRPQVWKETLSVSFQAAPKFGLDLPVAPSVAYGIKWPVDLMDSHDPLPTDSIAPNADESYGLVKGDEAQAHIWSTLGGVEVRVRANVAFKGTTVDAKAKAVLERYVHFWENLSSAYYAMPTGRRLICFQCCIALNPAFAGAVDVGRRPVGDMLLAEMLMHLDKYPDIKIPPNAGRSMPDNFPAMIGTGESFVAGSFFAPVFLKQKLTLAEDRGVRDALKNLGEANHDVKADRISLPNGQSVWLEPEVDAGHADERYTWFKQNMPHG